MCEAAQAQLAVTVTQDAVDAFNRAVGHGQGAPPPSGFASPLLAMTWLAQPAIRALVAKACPPGSLPVQTSQFIATPHPIAVGTSLLVSAAVTERNGEIILAYRCVDKAGVLRTEGEIGFIRVPEADLERLLS
jgi:hypothetical protein